MKGPQLATLVWLANLVVLAGGAFLGYSYWEQVKQDRSETYAKVTSPKTKEKRITWQNTTDNAGSIDHEVWRNTLLSPMKRPPAVSLAPSGGTLKAPTRLAGRGGVGNPRSYNWSFEGEVPSGVSLSTRSGAAVELRFSKDTPQDSQVTVRVANPQSGETAKGTYTLAFDEEVKPEVSDEELRRELEAWVNEQFKLLRLMYGSPSISSARVSSKETGSTLLLFAGMKFPEEFKNDMNENNRKLAEHDLEVIAVERDHVVMKGPSRRDEYKDRYYEVKLKMDPSVFEIPDINKLGQVKEPRNNKVPLPPESRKPPKAPDNGEAQPDNQASGQSTYDEETDTWTLGTDDYQKIDVNELAKYAKVVHDSKGQALGIQISDEIPKDNVVLARGAKRGDIIKSINGQAVKSMADIRRIVSNQRNAGVTKFVVNYERDGVPGSKTFNVPKKKD